MSMPYTFEPSGKHAKAYSTLSISTKDAVLICRVIRKKKLSTVKRLLDDLINKRKTVNKRYYPKVVSEIKKLLNSCEKNAEFQGMDKEKLFVYASAHKGVNMKRPRRRGDFGSGMKSTHVEIILSEKPKS